MFMVSKMLFNNILTTNIAATYSSTTIATIGVGYWYIQK
jgi:hypothetical protein